MGNIRGNSMELVQIIHDESGIHRIYKCEMCGYILTKDDSDIEMCPRCLTWARNLVKEMEENNKY